MSRYSCYVLAVIAALTVSSGAYARVNQAMTPGARASAVGTSETDTRRECVEKARSRWGSNSQDMQTPRDFLYRACMYEHGITNP